MKSLPRTILCACLVLPASNLTLGQFTATGPSNAADPTPTTADTRLLSPPKTAEEIASRLQLARQRLDALHPTTQPATTAPADEAETQRLEARLALFREWEAYLGQLQRNLEFHDANALRSSEAYIQKLTEQTVVFEKQRAAIGELSAPISATEDEVAAASTELKGLEEQLAALSDRQSRRTTQLTTGFKQQRETLATELEGLRQERQKAQEAATTAPATAPVDQERTEPAGRRRDVQIARMEAALQALTREQTLAQLAFKQDERLLETLRRLVTAYQQRVTALTEARSRGVLEQIAMQRERAAKPHEIAFLELAYFRENVLLTYFRNQALSGTLKDRFPESALDQLRNRVALSSTTWKELVDTLEQRTGAEALSVRQEMHEDRLAYEAEWVRLGGQLGQSLDALRELRAVRDRAVQRFHDLEREVMRKATSADAAERTRLETEATSLRSSMLDTMNTTITQVQNLVNRLREGIVKTRDHVAHLKSEEESLYWTALRRRESGLAGLDWGGIQAEFRQLSGRSETAQDDASPAGARTAPAAADLFPEEPNVRGELATRFRAVGTDFRALNGRFLWFLIVGLVLFGGLGVCARVVAKRHVDRVVVTGDRQATDAGTQSMGVGHRVRLFACMLARDASVPVGIALACWVVPWYLGLARPTHTLMVALIGYGLVMYVALVSAFDLFDPNRPERRVTGCRDETARHYRNWLCAALGFSAAVLFVPLVLYLTDAAPGIRSLFWEVFKGGLLLMLFVFAVRERRVLASTPQAPRSVHRYLVSAAYPLLVLAVFALLVLQVIGYGVLVEFVGAGILASLAVVLVIGSVVAWICEQLPSQPRVTSVSPVGPSTAADVAQPPPSGSYEDSIVVSGDQAPRLIGLLVRAVGVAIALLLLLRIWGIQADLDAVDWKTVGLGVLVVVVAIVVDRIVVTALFTLHMSDRLPESTANIIRRWSRGVLTLIAVLVLLALGGYQVTNVWTLLTGVAAMVAVGFVAVWSVLSNIMSTFIILFWKPFNVGEHVEILPEGVAGDVIDINFMYTLLQTEAGERTTVPNSLFLQKFIKRKSMRRRPRRSLAEQLAAPEPVSETNT